jgi:hypothetical protein
VLQRVEQGGRALGVGGAHEAESEEQSEQCTAHEGSSIEKG